MTVLEESRLLALVEFATRPLLFLAKLFSGAQGTTALLLPSILSFLGDDLFVSLLATLVQLWKEFVMPVFSSRILWLPVSLEGRV